MNISYEILWIDDQLDSIRASANVVEEYIDSLGFAPVLKLMSPIEDVDALLKDSRWHLIAMDYKLTKDITGADLIGTIREAEKYTEIVFYSSEPELVEEEVKQKALEGVYWATREGDELEEKIKLIIDLTLRRVMDVNTMRGIVMAEVAEMDHEMEDIIRCYHSEISEADKQKFIEKILGRIKSSIDGNSKKIAKYLSGCILDDCLNPSVIDSSKRLRTVEGIFKDKPGVASDAQSSKLTACADILTKRNTLAHGRTKRDANTEIVSSVLGDFRLEDAIELRKALRQQRKNFIELKNVLNDKLSNQKTT